MSHKCRAYSISGIGRGKANQKEIRHAFYNGWDMSKDNVIELAKQAGFQVDEFDDGIWLAYPLEIQRFAELVRNQTLEEAAKVCRKEAERALFNWKNDLPENQPFWNGAEQMAAGCANDIASRKSLK